MSRLSVEGFCILGFPVLPVQIKEVEGCGAQFTGIDILYHGKAYYLVASWRTVDIGNPIFLHGVTCHMEVSIRKENQRHHVPKYALYKSNHILLPILLMAFRERRYEN